jgi:hypothetical protein
LDEDTLRNFIPLPRCGEIAADGDARCPLGSPRDFLGDAVVRNGKRDIVDPLAML